MKVGYLVVLVLLISIFHVVMAASPQGKLVGAGTVSTGLQETSVAMTRDGETLYFMRSDFGEKDDTILVSRRRNGVWSEPEVASFSGQWHDSEPALSPDGQRLYFVSNRPVQPGGAPVTAEMSGQHFAGTNLWYVERQPDGRWGKPVHVDGALNDGAMIYNPSIAANGDIWFSAHRAGSGSAYQIYVARCTASGYAVAVRVDLGDIKHNRMDPAIDPQERFLVFAGNEGDARGRADLYIAFRLPDGRWSKPQHLPVPINSASLENAPSLGPRFGELFASSNRRDGVHFPKPRDTAATLDQRLAQPLNGSRNPWRFDIADVLRAHGVSH
jgi:hypothetical protein